MYVAYSNRLFKQREEFIEKLLKDVDAYYATCQNLTKEKEKYQSKCTAARNEVISHEIKFAIACYRRDPMYIPLLLFSIYQRLQCLHTIHQVVCFILLDMFLEMLFLLFLIRSKAVRKTFLSCKKNWRRRI